METLKNSDEPIGGREEISLKRRKKDEMHNDEVQQIANIHMEVSIHEEIAARNRQAAIDSSVALPDPMDSVGMLDCNSTGQGQTAQNETAVGFSQSIVDLTEGLAANHDNQEALPAEGDSTEGGDFPDPELTGMENIQITYGYLNGVVGCEMLVDSGSTNCCLPLSMFKRLGLKQGSLISWTKNSGVSTGNGIFKPIGKALITIGQKKNSDVALKIWFMILEDFNAPYPCLIGNDFLLHYSAVLDIPHGELRLGKRCPNPSLRIWPVTSKRDYGERTSFFKTRNSLTAADNHSSLFVQEAVYVPPGATTSIWCPFPSFRFHSHPRYSSFFQQPKHAIVSLSPFWERMGLRIPGTLLVRPESIKGNFFTVRVTNTADVPIPLAPGRLNPMPILDIHWSEEGDSIIEYGKTESGTYKLDVTDAEADPMIIDDSLSKIASSSSSS